MLPVVRNLLKLDFFNEVDVEYVAIALLWGELLGPYMCAVSNIEICFVYFVYFVRVSCLFAYGGTTF